MFVFGVNLGNGNYLGVLVVLILTIVAFSGLGIMAASFIMVTKRGDPVTTLVGGVGLLLGGVYYPVELLPSWPAIFGRADSCYLIRCVPCATRR